MTENSKATGLFGHVPLLDERPQVVRRCSVNRIGMALDNNLNETMKNSDYEVSGSDARESNA